MQTWPPLLPSSLEKVQEDKPLKGILKRKGPALKKVASQPSCLVKDRRLKQESSDVSMDAHGFPTMFASPGLSKKAEEAKALEKAGEATDNPRSRPNRPGQRSLKEAMGFVPCKAKAKGNGKAKPLEKAKAKALGKAIAKKPAAGSLGKKENTG